MKDERSLTGEFKRSHVIPEFPALPFPFSTCFELSPTYKKCEKWRRLEVQGFCRYDVWCIITSGAAWNRING